MGIDDLIPKSLLVGSILRCHQRLVKSRYPLIYGKASQTVKKMFLLITFCVVVLSTGFLQLGRVGSRIHLSPRAISAGCITGRVDAKAIELSVLWLNYRHTGV